MDPIFLGVVMAVLALVITVIAVLVLALLVWIIFQRKRTQSTEDPRAAPVLPVVSTPPEWTGSHRVVIPRPAQYVPPSVKTPDDLLERELAATQVFPRKPDDAQVMPRIKPAAEAPQTGIELLDKDPRAAEWDEMPPEGRRSKFVAVDGGLTRSKRGGR